MARVCACRGFRTQYVRKIRVDLPKHLTYMSEYVYVNHPRTNQHTHTYTLDASTLASRDYDTFTRVVLVRYWIRRSLAFGFFNAMTVCVQSMRGKGKVLVVCKGFKRMSRRRDATIDRSYFAKATTVCV